MAYSIGSDSIRSCSDMFVNEMFCESCKKDQKHSVASGFCVDCVEYFCEVCVKFHGRFLPNHVFQDAETMPRDFCTEMCDIHVSEIIKFICLDCDKVACSKCRLQCHKTCNNLQHIPAYVKSEKFKGSLQDFMKTLTSTDTRLKTAIKTSKSNLTEIETYCYIAKLKVKKHKRDINIMLDRLAKDIEKVAENVRAADQETMSVLQAKYESLSLIINPIQANVEELNETGKLTKALLVMEKTKNEVKDVQDEMARITLEGQAICETLRVYDFVPDRSLLQLENIGKLAGLMADKTFTRPTCITNTIQKDLILRVQKDPCGELDVKALPSVKLAVAVFGEPGSGKSLFIKSLLGLEDDYSMEDCCTEASIALKSYGSSRYPYVVMYEFPEVGTKRAQGCKHVSIKCYNIFFIISRQHFSEKHIKLANEINKCSSTNKETKIKASRLYFVRTHIQEDIDNDKDAHPQTHNPQNVLREIQEDCEMKLKCHFQSPIYLIDSFETSQYDFSNLVESFVADISQVEVPVIRNPTYIVS